MLGLSISAKTQESFTQKMIGMIQKRQPDQRIVVGGGHASASSAEFASLGVEVVRGEGEQAIIDLLQGKTIEEIHTRPGNGHLDLPPFTERLHGNSIPAVNYDLLHLPEGIKLDDFNIHFSISRGCTGKCFFCISPTVWSGGIRRKKLERVRLDIQKLFDAGVKTVDIEDDIINTDIKYFKQLCNILSDYRSMEFVVMSRLDTLDEEFIKTMSEAGVFNIFFGVESTQAPVLKKMNKGLFPPSYKNMLKKAKEYGIRIGTFWVFGHPGSTREMDLGTIADMHEWFTQGIIDEAGFVMYLPIPGTVSANHPDIQLLDGIRSEDWTGMKPVHRLTKPNGSVIYHEDEMTEVFSRAKDCPSDTDKRMDIISRSRIGF